MVAAWSQLWGNPLAKSGYVWIGYACSVFNVFSPKTGVLQWILTCRNLSGDLCICSTITVASMKETSGVGKGTVSTPWKMLQQRFHSEGNDIITDPNLNLNYIISMIRHLAFQFTSLRYKCMNVPDVLFDLGVLVSYQVCLRVWVCVYVCACVCVTWEWERRECTNVFVHCCVCVILCLCGLCCSNVLCSSVCLCLICACVSGCAYLRLRVLCFACVLLCVLCFLHFEFVRLCWLCCLRFCVSDVCRCLCLRVCVCMCVPCVWVCARVFSFFPFCAVVCVCVFVFVFFCAHVFFGCLFFCAFVLVSIVCVVCVVCADCVAVCFCSFVSCGVCVCARVNCAFVSCFEYFVVDVCVCVSVFLCLCLMAVRNCQLCQGSLSWWCRRCICCRHPDTWRVVRGMASRSKVDTWGPKKGSTNRTWLSSTPAFFGDFNGFQWISTYPFFRGKLKLKNTWSFCASFCASQFIFHRFFHAFPSILESCWSWNSQTWLQKSPSGLHIQRSPVFFPGLFFPVFTWFHGSQSQVRIQSGTFNMLWMPTPIVPGRAAAHAYHICFIAPVQHWDLNIKKK